MFKKLPKVYKKSFIIGAVLCLAVAAVYGGVRLRSQPASTPVGTGGDNSYSGPTNQELKETKEHKEQVLNNQTQPPDANNPPSSVTPVITAKEQVDQQVRVTAFVPGLIQNSGSCLLKAVKGAHQVTKTVAAAANASTTDCAPFLMNRTDFAESGNWNITVTYTSTTLRGVSSSEVILLK